MYMYYVAPMQKMRSQKLENRVMGELVWLNYIGTTNFQSDPQANLHHL